MTSGPSSGLTAGNGRARLAARTTFALTAAVVLVGMATQVWVSANLEGTRWDSKAALVANVFCFFTVQSNLLVGATTALLAVRPERDGPTFRVLRLAGLVGITITFVVFHLVLAELQHLQGSAALADWLLHTVSPLLAVAGWLAFGPRGRVSVRTALLATAFPLLWGVLTLVRGAWLDFYPYPFVDVLELGYGRVLVNALIVAGLYLVVAVGAAVVDRWLVSRRRPD